MGIVCNFWASDIITENKILLNQLPHVQIRMHKLWLQMTFAPKLAAYTLFDLVLQHLSFFITNFEQVYYEVFSVRNIYFTFCNSDW